ncbi:type 4 pilus major pilin [Janthinobacterium sp. FW305-128]|uniref:type 4 pilus major pilin n=1 Tax=Janthinobacterium sp. FW305-128 TaxID=2775055 RepID=UPI001E57BB07|nr:type 4 pilus major pilin [Janthinobacterium sp. FW305-128]MCC7684710.1 hypothetical protein [Janthinobacterium sp. FW305-128]
MNKNEIYTVNAEKKVSGRSFKKQGTKRSGGFVLGELAIAMIFIGVVGIASYGIWQYLMTDNAIDSERDTITSYVSRGLAAIDHMDTTTTVTTQLFINNRVFRSGVVGTTVKNKLGGFTTATSANTIAGTDDAIMYTNTGYPRDACTDLPIKINGLTYSMTINGTSVKTGDVGLNTTTVGDACKAGTTNTIAFVVAKR